MNTGKFHKNVITGFVESAKRFSQRPALIVNDETISYEALARRASNIAKTIVDNESKPAEVASIFAYRSQTAYAGILGILSSGKGYVPLNPKFPIERTRRMLSLSKSNVIVVGKECLQNLKELLTIADERFTIIFPDVADIVDLAKDYPQHKFISASDMSTGSDLPDVPLVDPNSFAYILFTSGSTGIPKGVPVSQKSVVSYVKFISKNYSLSETDRFSQTFDLTFDLSVHDMFVCWENGACLCCVPDKSVMAPAKFIKEKQISVWFSVPAVAMFADKMRMLKPNSFPRIRLSLFCGEALPASLAAKWQKAAPHSIIDNLYGPTEATIAITKYRWDEEKSPEKCLNGIVPIGWVFEGQKACIIDQNRNLAHTGASGELCLAGSQVTQGYLNNIEKTKEQFITIPELGNDIWYKTGDSVKQDKDGCLYYLGRIDNQLQVLGYRVELGEIDSTLRAVSGSEMAVSIGWPIEEGIAQGIVAFICGGEAIRKSAILEYCQKNLPDYMIPKEIHFVDSMPLNANGKIDRLELSKRLKG